MTRASFRLLILLSWLIIVVLLWRHVHHNHLLLLLRMGTQLGVNWHDQIVVHGGLLILVVHILDHLLRVHLNRLDHL